MNLSPEDRALVLESRAHWVRMRDDPERCKEQPSAEDCALCQKYLFVHRCAGCPVRLVNGCPRCGTVPYSSAREKFYFMRIQSLGCDELRAAVIAFQEAADRVIAWIDEHLLAEDVALADDQQLPSEVTRAVERKRGGDASAR